VRRGAQPISASMPAAACMLATRLVDDERFAMGDVHSGSDVVKARCSPGRTACRSPGAVQELLGAFISAAAAAITKWTAAAASPAIIFAPGSPFALRAMRKISAAAPLLFLGTRNDTNARKPAHGRSEERLS